LFNLDDFSSTSIDLHFQNRIISIFILIMTFSMIIVDENNTEIKLYVVNKLFNRERANHQSNGI
jgi:isocitrate dehydrogenase kinase/phosphatase